MTCTDPTDAAGFADEEYGLPCAEALLAGTMALMTGHAQACCEGQRALMARKVADNLQLLSRHAALSAPFRAMVVNLAQRWAPPDAADQPLPPHRLWHRAPGALQ